MAIQTDASPLALDRPDDVYRARDALDRAGFDDRHVRERMAVDESVEIGFGTLDRPRMLRRTRDGDPLAALIRVFLAGVPVPLDGFRRAVAPMDPAGRDRLGLVEVDGDTARRTVTLLPIEGFVIAHDACMPEGSARRDHVMGGMRATAAFVWGMMPIPARRTLDPGTGCGYLALLAAGQSQQVLATDVTTRAVATARFNVLLNRVDNVECESSVFEPAGDLRLELIASDRLKRRADRFDRLPERARNSSSRVM